MLCPACGERPCSFGKWIRTLDPFNVECRSCHAALRAAPLAYIWTLVHVPIGIGITAMLRSPAARGSLGILVVLSVMALAILFVTAYVIPYYYIDRCYRLSDLTRES